MKRLLVLPSCFQAWKERKSTRWTGHPVLRLHPDQSPTLMAAASNHRDIGQWAAKEEIVTARAGK